MVSPQQDTMKKTFINQQRTLIQHNRCMRDPHSHLTEGGLAGSPRRQWKEVRGSPLPPQWQQSGAQDLTWQPPCNSKGQGGGQPSVGTPSLSELPPSLWGCSTLRKLSNCRGIFTKPSSPGGQTASGEQERTQDHARERKCPALPQHTSSAAQLEQGIPARAHARTHV